jgi:class 3 adenylate cyclase
MSGPLSIAYTARYPNNVDRLILYGTYANGTELAPKELQHAIISLIEASWGLGSKALADVFNPDADAEVLQRHARYQRLSSSPEMAAKLLELCYAVDVTEALSSIKIPTLILHREDDKAMSIQNGRNLSTEISNSNFKILGGNQHPMWDGESNDIIKEILEFIGEKETQGYIINKAAHSNIDESEIAEQTTIMFTDIVSSTDIVTEIGDTEARNLFAQHDKLIKELVNKYGGTELQNLGDGFMLSFPSATSAIQCACALQIAISQNLPLIKVKIGINTGEVVKREGKHPFGQAVVIASRIVEECSGKQILISDISKRLAAGSKFEFLEIGKFKPKGLDYNVELFKVVWAE